MGLQIHAEGDVEIDDHHSVEDVGLTLGMALDQVFDLPVIRGRWVGRFDCDLVEEFFQALVVQARMNLHLHLRAGGNVHHVIEAAFKGFARALRMACAPDPALGSALPTTKGAV